MRSRRSSEESAADVTRRRLEALIAELGQARGEEPPPAEPSTMAPGEPAGQRPARQADPEACDGRRVTDRASPGRHAARPAVMHERVGGWLGDRVPVTLRGRAHLGSAQFGLVALVVAVGLVIGAWWLVRAGGQPRGVGETAPPRPTVTVSAPSAAASSAAASPPDASPAAPGSGEAAPTVAEGIVVDVVGEVRRPGIAVLPAGARVVDAVRAAGGMKRGVDPATVNLARPLTDGEQVVIGVSATGAVPSPEPPVTGEPATGGALVNLNTADQTALETLPGVGPVTAAAILEWREQHGGFTSVDELLEVSGIGEATLAEIAPHVTL